MIKDKINRLEIYNSLDKNIEGLKELCSNPDRSSIEKFPYKVIQLKYETGDFNFEFENHQKFIDFHYIISGEEFVFVTDVEKLSPVNQYNDKDDYQILKGQSENKILLKQGDFLILYPGEAHFTSAKNKFSQEVKKLVVKIPL